MSLHRFSANISFLFNDRPFLDRISAAAIAGFAAVECHSPYDHTIEEIRNTLNRAGIGLNGINTQPGDLTQGEWGRAALPDRERDFDEDFEQALTYAKELGVGSIHVMSGIVSQPFRDAARRTFAANLRRAAPRAQEHGIVLLVEPLNTRDKPGYLFSRSDDVVAFLEEVGAPNVRLLFDVYHIQIMEGDLITRLERHRPHLGHVQVAAVPSRHEPDGGEVSLPAILDTLRQISYNGWIGCEYRPAKGTEDGLGWLRRLGV